MVAEKHHLLLHSRLIDHLLITADLLGFENYIPPFAYANGSAILDGVNYASGGAGIRRETGITTVIIHLSTN
jgi:hypothetical protein